MVVDFVFVFNSGEKLRAGDGMKGGVKVGLLCVSYALMTIIQGGYFGCVVRKRPFFTLRYIMVQVRTVARLSSL